MKLTIECGIVDSPRKIKQNRVEEKLWLRSNEIWRYTMKNSDQVHKTTMKVSTADITMTGRSTWQGGSHGSRLENTALWMRVDRNPIIEDRESIPRIALKRTVNVDESGTDASENTTTNEEVVLLHHLHTMPLQ